ncbi:MAG: hypothetical protein ACYC5Y_07235 [Symbiobacteriia bacterium]
MSQIRIRPNRVICYISVDLSPNTLGFKLPGHAEAVKQVIQGGVRGYDHRLNPTFTLCFE